MPLYEQPPDSKLVPIILVVGNILGVGLGYLLTILFARNLSHSEFENYVGSIATLTLLASMGEAGFGKYALRVVPVLVANSARHLLKGYLRFAVVGAFVASLLIGCIALAFELQLRSGLAERLIVLAIFFVPAMACCGVVIDLLLAFQMPTTATVLARIVIPLTSLLAAIILIYRGELTAYLAILCFTAGSVVALLIGAAICHVKSRTLTRNFEPQVQWRSWISEGVSFMVFGFLTSWVFRATLVMTHHLPHGKNELAMLAPAFETGCLILLLSKSTDKYFQPILSVVMDTGDWRQGRKMRKTRYLIIGTGAGVFFLLIVLFGPSILRLYGDDFVEAYPALLLVALGSCVWTVFSLAPIFLLFAKKRAWLLGLFLSHGIALAGLTAVLYGPFGATGAATAYAIAVTSLALCCWQSAEHALFQMQSADSDFAGVMLDVDGDGEEATLCSATVRD